MTFEVLIGFDSRSYARLSVDAADIEALKQVDYRSLIQDGLEVERTECDFPKNITLITATDENFEIAEILYDFEDDLKTVDHIQLSQDQVKELVTAVENGVAYNSDVYQKLRSQLANEEGSK